MSKNRFALGSLFFFCDDFKIATDHLLGCNVLGLLVKSGPKI